MTKERIFLDTEFTHLNSGAKLISLALVGEDGSSIYVELPDNYKASDLGAFAAEHVVPCLWGGHFQMTRHEAKTAVLNWLKSRKACLIATDAPNYDMHFLLDLVGTLPDNVDPQPLILSMNYLWDYDRFISIVDANNKNPLYHEHNAYHDARNNLDAWRRSGKDCLEI